MTEDEAQRLIERLVGTANPIELHPFEFGWLAKETPSTEQRATGAHVGMGCYIIDRSGTVTVHSSLPIPVVMKQYAAARRQGRISGHQIWPRVATVDQPMRG